MGILRYPLEEDLKASKAFQEFTANETTNYLLRVSLVRAVRLAPQEP